MSRRADNLRKPCVVCARPSDWRHHVAGHANAPEVTCDVCRSHGDLLDAFLSLAGVKLKHGEPRTDAELAWATIAGLDGLRAARDGNAAVSPIALAAGRLLATHSAYVRGPRPGATDARLRRRRQAAITTSFEAARARAAHDLLATFPAVTDRYPDLVGLLNDLAAAPQTFELSERVDSEAVEPLYASFERAAVALLDTWRADVAGDPDARAALPFVGRRFERAIRSLAEQLVGALVTERSREAPA
jgi:hypothetical protein